MYFSEAVDEMRDTMFQHRNGTGRHGKRLALLATVTVGESGWVDLVEAIIVRAGGVDYVAGLAQEQ